MKGLLQPEDLRSLPLVAAWLKHAEATRRVLDENYADFEGEALLNAAIKENVLMQLDNLRTYPAVAARLTKGNLTLHAWVYQIDSGSIYAFDPQLSRYVPMTDQLVAAATQRPSIVSTIQSEAATAA
ncbi:MAG TPA: carbonic anhydrase, partial [Blastocatellia bacterium]|nr:carbonic anhydrase [Blastocatellia bacterium]